MGYPYFYSKYGTRPKEDSRRPVTRPMAIEGKGQELQRYSRRSPTPTPSHDDRWTKSGWQDWSTNNSWKETQGESEQRQYAAVSTSRGSDWRPTPVPKPAPSTPTPHGVTPKRAAAAPLVDERPVQRAKAPPSGYGRREGTHGTQGTPSTPNRPPSAVDPALGTRMDYPHAPIYEPMSLEIPQWAMEDSHVTPRLKLVVEMALIANHLPPMHLTP
eukprot:2395436-Amphidinium_carterae.1